MISGSFSLLQAQERAPISGVQGPASITGAVPAQSSGFGAAAVLELSGSSKEEENHSPFENETPKAIGETSSAESATETEKPKDPQELTEAEQTEVQDLQKRDREVRTHEQAHKSAGGHHAGAIHYDFERGPDGRNYAVGGHVPIDVSPIDGDPQATLRKMAKVQRAALAPASPSAADRQVASKAARYASQARAELSSEHTRAPNEQDAQGPTTSAQATQDARAPAGSQISLTA